MTQYIPDWNDTIFLKKLENFIKAFGERYDGNPNIAYIDIRAYGNWGEQHVTQLGGTPIASEALYNNYIKPYEKYFKHTQLVNPYGLVQYNDTYFKSIDEGVSIRRDGIMASYTGKECFQYAYGKLPTIFEFHDTYNNMKKNGQWSEEKVLEYINEWKPSYMDFYPEMYKDSPDFCKYIANRIGYYFKFNNAHFKNLLTDNEETNIKLNFSNEGVTPLYEPCTVYIGLLDKNYNVVKKYKTDINVKSWQPDKSIEENVKIKFENINTGDYILAVGLFYNDTDDNPTYLMGSTGKTDKNWYVFGDVTIDNVSNKKEYLNEIIKTNEEIKNSYNVIYSNENINSTYNNLISSINNQINNIGTTKLENINQIFETQYELINKVVQEYNNGKLNINKENYKLLLQKLFDVSNNYHELFKLYVTEDNIENKTVQDKINEIIYRYNNNTDIDISFSTDFINNLKEQFEKITTDDVVSNYIYKREIQNRFKIIEAILEYDIKQNADDEAKNISAESNTNELTNQNVIVTIELPNNSYIENYENNQIVFIENGTKDITINIRGYEYTYSLSISNIDKKAPTILNVMEGIEYLKEVAPKAEDENLKDTKLYYEGSIVNNYYNGAKLTDAGSYVIVATDKAGNETRINFSIYDITSKEYTISESYIKNISKLTQGKKVADNINIKGDFKLFRNNNIINNTSNVATGDILKVETSTFTLIVTGDITKTSDVNVKDLVKLRRYLLNTDKLDDIEKLAADVNTDSQINIKDLVGLRRIILK